MTTDLVLAALEQDVWTRQRTGRDLGNLLRHNDAGSQCTSIRHSERLDEAGIAGSVGSVGDSYDNAPTESINGLYKTELIKPRGQQKSGGVGDFVAPAPAHDTHICSADIVDCTQIEIKSPGCERIADPADMAKTESLRLSYELTGKSLHR